MAYFAEAVEQGSLSAAAKKQFVTVQAVSKAIADLEAELDRSLLIRGSRGVRPTEFGELFYRKSLQVLANFEDLELFAQSYGKPAAGLGQLRIGLNTPPFWGNDQIRAGIASVIEKQLGIKATVPLVPGERGISELRVGLLDALITIGLFNHPDVSCTAVGTLSPAVMMKDDHPLARKQLLTLTDLAPYPIANSNWFSNHNNTIVSRYRESGVELQYVDVYTENVWDHLSRNGLMFTVGIEMLERLAPGIALRLIAPEDAIPTPICFVNMGNTMSPALATLQSMVESWLKMINGGGVL